MSRQGNGGRIPRAKGEPTKVDALLSSALRKLGLDSRLDRYRFVMHWSEIVGPEIAKRTKPECLRNGALVVRVSSSAWAQELSFQKETILKRLSRFLDKSDSVTDISFYVAK